MKYKIFLVIRLLFICSVALGLPFTLLAQEAGENKPTAEWLLNKHLKSIGSDEARSSIKSATIVGTSKATFFGRGRGTAEGIAVLASESDKYMVAMKFNNSDYPMETMGFDGKEFSVGFVKPGVRSNFGSFLRSNEGTFKRGIISGVLSASWVLLNFDQNTAKIKYEGTKKIDGKKVYVLAYNPKKGSDLEITLYFDTENFRHVRTEYKRVIAARQGANVDASAGQSETRHTLIEDFSDFREEGKLILPHTYKISLEILTGNGTTSYEWLMQLQKFSFNHEIDDKDFRVDAY